MVSVVDSRLDGGNGSYTYWGPSTIGLGGRVGALGGGVNRAGHCMDVYILRNDDVKGGFHACMMRRITPIAGGGSGPIVWLPPR